MSGANDHRSVLDAIASWVRNYRQAMGLRSELANCTAEEVALLARDIGLSAEELMSAAAKGPHAADELPKLLRALGVDPRKLASDDASTLRDLQRICIHCGHKGECRHDLAAGTAARSYRDYCPNAMSIEALFQAK
jgi:uncharacterized protein YjiS (DUF1127 family)